MSKGETDGNWEQSKGKVKEQWGRLTDDDMMIIEGRRDQLVGKTQERYGYQKDQVGRGVDSWEKRHDHRWWLISPARHVQGCTLF